MQLAEQGRLDLDTSVQRYLPSFVTADQDASSTITVRHLLNQTSGIPKSAVKELQVGGGDETIEDAVHQLDRVHLTAPIGTTFQYSNLNYVTLGLIVQVVSGEPYGTYVERHIFAPLGMRDSFASPPAAHQHGLATPYHWIFGMPVPGVLPFNDSILPAGSLISSADDLTRYLTAQLNVVAAVLVHGTPAGYRVRSSMIACTFSSVDGTQDRKSAFRPESVLNTARSATHGAIAPHPKWREHRDQDGDPHQRQQDWVFGRKAGGGERVRVAP